MDTLEANLSRLEAAKALGISVSKVDKDTATGQLVATKIGRRTVYQPQHLRAYLEAQTREATMPANADSAVVADELKSMVRCFMRRDHARMAKVVNNSRYPHKLHLAAALNVIARMVAESSDPEKLLDAIGEIVARD